jgi:hypothetical protein
MRDVLWQTHSIERIRPWIECSARANFPWRYRLHCRYQESPDSTPIQKGKVRALFSAVLWHFDMY